MSWPDWRTQSDYEFCDSLNAEAWAWEFLRRNPDYQREYTDAVQRESADQLRFGELHFPLTQDTRHKLFYYPDKLPNESFADWAKRCKDHYVKPIVMTPSQDLAFRWYLDEAASPTASPPLFTSPFDPYAFDLDLAFDIKNGIRVQREGYLIGVFRYELNHNQQLDHMRQYLRAGILFETERDRLDVLKSRQVTDLWKSYLRVLDAHVAGNSSTEIFPIIATEKEKQRSLEEGYDRRLISDRLASAKKLRREYYLCLLLDKPVL